MIRIAEFNDLKFNNDIYNQAVSSDFETADTDPIILEYRAATFNQQDQNLFPLYVYELNSKVVAWISFNPYRPGRKALRFTAEISSYVNKDYKRQGIGSKLLKFSLEQSGKLKFKTLIAIVLDRNLPSINLLKKFNFNEWGHLPSIADFNGVECGHVYYGIRI